MIKKINKIIREEILREYHHSFGNGLEQDAENILNIIFEYVQKHNFNLQNLNSFDLFMYDGQITISRYYVKDLNVNLNIRIDTRKEMLNNSTFGFKPIPAINVGFGLVEKAMNDKNYVNELVSIIYHEIGHSVNYTKSNNKNLMSKSFKNPIFSDLSNDSYQQLIKLMYCFHRREMWARCFQTTLYLKKQGNKKIPIQDVYDNFCSRISEMKKFLGILEKIKNKGENSFYAIIMKDIFEETYRKQLNSRKNSDISWEKMCNGTIKYFYSRYIWFKKRIDKIYYDYISS